MQTIVAVSCCLSFLRGIIRVSIMRGRFSTSQPRTTVKDILDYPSASLHSGTALSSMQIFSYIMKLYVYTDIFTYIL